MATLMHPSRSALIMPGVSKKGGKYGDLANLNNVKDNGSSPVGPVNIALESEMNKNIVGDDDV